MSDNLNNELSNKLQELEKKLLLHEKSKSRRMLRNVVLMALLIVGISFISIYAYNLPKNSKEVAARPTVDSLEIGNRVANTYQFKIDSINALLSQKIFTVDSLTNALNNTDFGKESKIVQLKADNEKLASNNQVLQYSLDKCNAKSDSLLKKLKKAKKGSNYMW